MSDIPNDPGKGPPAGPARAQKIDIPSLFAEASRLKGMGNLDHSEAIYLHILQGAPNHAESFYELSHIHIDRGNLEVASKSLIAAISLKPNFLQAHMALGAIHRSEERNEEAEKCFREAIQCRQDHAEAHFLLGICLKDQDRLDEAIKSLKEAISLKPEYAEAHIYFGSILRDSGDLEGAVEHFREAVRIGPGDIKSYFQLGAALHESGKFQESLDVFMSARAIDPDSPEMHFGLGAAYAGMNKPEESLDNFKKAIDLKPDYLDAYYHLSNTYTVLGNIEEDEAILRKARARWPGETQMKLILDMAYPAFPDPEEIDRRRIEINESLDHYDPETLNVSLKNLTTFARPPSFYMAYHGRDDLALKSKYADLFARYFEKEFPDALWGGKKFTSGATSGSASGIRRRPRIGFLVTLHGPFMPWLKGLAEKLSNEKFEVTIICSGRARESISEQIENEEIDYLPIKQDFMSAIQSIREQDFDVVLYHESGTDPTNYFMPFFRLAPVQCISYAYGYTTGIPGMDYFVSSDLIEPENGDSHYREQLIRLPSLGFYFNRPKPPDKLNDRAHFGFSASDHIYACPQNLFKIHPEFFAPLGEILRRDPAGSLVFIENQNPAWNAELMSRLGAAFPDCIDRVRMVPRQEYVGFFSLLSAADVLLDPIHSCGGTTTLESLASGTPIVTWPGEFARGRFTSACYRRMGVADCVAPSLEEYVEIAVRLGTDPDEREAVGQKIRAASHLVYEDMDAVRDWEAFFEKAVEESRRKSP